MGYRNLQQKNGIQDLAGETNPSAYLAPLAYKRACQRFYLNNGSWYKYNHVTGTGTLQSVAFEPKFTVTGVKVEGTGNLEYDCPMEGDDTANVCIDNFSPGIIHNLTITRLPLTPLTTVTAITLYR